MVDGCVFDDNALTIVRRAFARQMVALAEAGSDPILEDALAMVPRERFLGPPPWYRAAFDGGYRALPSDDPVLVYQDILIALSRDRGVNNGSPSLHARWLHRARPGRGDRVVHIGAGAGYYSAVIAHMVGGTGNVCAVEYDPALAALARDNLAPYANVAVIEDDGATWPREPVDCVYVNVLAQRPADAWIEGLAPGGRLILPLGVPHPHRGIGGGRRTLHGAGLCIERREEGFAAEWLGPAYFIAAEGTLADASGRDDALKAAFEKGGLEFVRSLVWMRPTPPERCWHIGDGWALSYDPIS